MELVIQIDEKQKQEIGAYGFANIPVNNLSVSYVHFSKEKQKIIQDFLKQLSAVTITDNK